MEMKRHVKHVLHIWTVCH